MNEPALRCLATTASRVRADQPTREPCSTSVRRRGYANEPSTCYDGNGNAADSQQRDHGDHHEEQRPRRPTAPRTTRVHAAARALSSSSQRRTSSSRWDAFSMRCLRASGNPHAAASRAIFVKTTSSSPTSPSSSTSSAWNPGAGPHLPRHHRVLQLHRRNPKRPAFRRGGAACGRARIMFFNSAQDLLFSM